MVLPLLIDILVLISSGVLCVDRSIGIYRACCYLVIDVHVFLVFMVL
jgi:hypothetical protein